MADQNVMDYIASKRRAGESDESIRKELLAANWTQSQIDDAMSGTKASDPNKVPTPPSRIYGVGELVTKSFELFKKKFLVSIAIVLSAAVLASVLAFSTGLVVGFMSKGMSSVAISIIAMLLTAAIMVFVVIFEIWGSAALIYNLLSEEKKGFKESFKNTWKYVGRFWWLSIIEMLVLSGGLVMLLIPGIIFTIWFIFSQLVLVDEGEKGMNAMMKSKEYVKGYWWMIFGRLLFVLFIFFVAGVIFSVITQAAQIDKNTFVKLLNSVISVVIGLYSTTYLVTMYKNIKSVKGSVDISGKSKVVWIIIAVIGLLSFIALPVAMIASINPGKQIEKANNARNSLNEQQLEMAVQLYYSQYQKYPEKLEQLIPEFVKVVPLPSDKASCYQVVINGKSEVIVKTVPLSSGIDCNKVINTLQ